MLTEQSGAPCCGAIHSRAIRCGAGGAKGADQETNSASTSPSATFPQAPASGTRSSTACSRTSVKTGAPLISYRVIVNLIAATTTRTGLSVHCELDPNQYPKGILVSDAEMAASPSPRVFFGGSPRGRSSQVSRNWPLEDFRK